MARTTKKDLERKITILNKYLEDKNSSRRLVLGRHTGKTHIYDNEGRDLVLGLTTGEANDVLRGMMEVLEMSDVKSKKKRKSKSK